MIKKRNIIICILLSIITLFIYTIYWFITLTNDIEEISNREEYKTKGYIAFLLCLCTFSLYGIYWTQKMSRSLFKTRLNRGLYAKKIIIKNILLGVITLGIYPMCSLTYDLNKLIDESNANYLKKKIKRVA